MEQLLTASESTKTLWSQWGMIQVQRGMVYRLLPATQRKPAYYQLLLPACCREDFIKEIHEKPEGKHIGLRRTLDEVQRKAFWVGWRKDVVEFCRRCTSCCVNYRGKLQQPAASRAITSRRRIGDNSIRRIDGQHDKWQRKLPEPYPVEKSPGPVSVTVPRKRRMKPFASHRDKLRKLQGTTPPPWIDLPASVDSGTEGTTEVKQQHGENNVPRLPPSETNNQEVITSIRQIGGDSDAVPVPQNGTDGTETAEKETVIAGDPRSTVYKWSRPNRDIRMPLRFLD